MIIGIYIAGCVAAFFMLRKTGNDFDQDCKTEGYILLDYGASFFSWPMFLLTLLIWSALKFGEDITGIKLKKDEKDF